MLLLLSIFCLINISIFSLFPYLIGFTFHLIRRYTAILNTLQIIFISTKEHPTLTKPPVSEKMYTNFFFFLISCRWVDLDRFSFKWLKSYFKRERERRSKSSDSILLSSYADTDKFSFYVLNFSVYWNK